MEAVDHGGAITPLYDLESTPNICPVMGRFLGAWLAGRRTPMLLELELSNTKTDMASEHHRQWEVARWLINEHLPAWFEVAELREEARYCRGLVVLHERRMELVPQLVPLVHNAGYDRGRHQSTLWPYNACPDLTVLSGAALEASRWLRWQAWIKDNAKKLRPPQTLRPPFDVVLAARLALHRAFVSLACLRATGFGDDVADVQRQQESGALTMVRRWVKRDC